MATLTEVIEWTEGIYQLETDDPVLGGADGIDNVQAKQLANRTQWLKQQMESAAEDLTSHIDSSDDPHPMYWNDLRGEAKISAAVTALVNSSPAALDTLAELATALGNDPAFATTITNLLATKAAKTDVQAMVYSSASAAGTSDAITAAFTPAISQLTNGLTVFIRATAANTTTTPTFSPASATIAAKAIVKGANVPLVAGDIAGAGFWAELRYDATLEKWVMMNPATGVNAGMTQTQADARYTGIGYMLVRDEKASGTDGGATTAGATTIRTLNTVSANSISGASLASNQVTLPAGTYRVCARAPICGANLNKASWYNVTDSAVVAYGTSDNGAGNSTSDIVTTWTTVNCRFTITAAKVFELRHYTQQTKSTTGFGDAVSLSGAVEVYSVVEIIKEA